jgi:3-oxoacyl-[acyl-carrier-protein] synthase II
MSVGHPAHRSVVVTGIGLVTGLGVGTTATWQRLLDGDSAVRDIDAYDTSTLSSRLAAPVEPFDPTRFASKRQLRTMVYTDRLALAAASLAVQDAALPQPVADGDRAALFIGSGKEISDPDHLRTATLAGRRADGGIDIHRFGESAMSTAYPLFFIEGLQGASLFYLSQAFGLRGTNTYFAGTSESSATAVACGYRAVRRGEADLAVVGGADDAGAWWSMSKLDATGALTRRNELGRAACRPFDLGRTGTVVGDGAAFLVLEDRRSAVRRGAQIYAEMVGSGSSQEPAAGSGAAGVTRAVRSALRHSRAAAGPCDVDLVVAHGTGTALGDRSEADGLRAAVGRRQLVTSVVPSTGHIVAAAGALNAAVAALAVHHGTAPATLNIDIPDPACEVTVVGAGPPPRQISSALAIARGSHGQTVALALLAA